MEQILSEWGFNIVYTVMFTIAALKVFINFMSVFNEMSLYKKQGKTPLVAKNLLGVTISGVVGLVAVILMAFLAKAVVLPTLFVAYTMWTVIGITILLYLTFQVASYFGAWGAWAVMIRLEKKRKLKEIETEREQVKQAAKGEEA